MDVNESRYVEEVRELRPLVVQKVEVMPLTEAARVLGLRPSAVFDLCKRGHMRRVLDLNEPNSRKRGRVLRVDVEKELARRRERRGDKRLKHKRR